LCWIDPVVSHFVSVPFCGCSGNVLVRTSLVPRDESIFEKIFHAIFGRDSPKDADEVIKRTIVFLDAGIATTLGESDRKNLYDLFRAVITNKGAEAGRLMVQRAKHERCSQMEGGVDAFANGIAEIVSEFHDRRKQGLTLGSVRIGSLLSRVLDLCRIYGVEVDPAMANVVISTLVLEGLGRSLEPSLNLIDFALPFVIGRGRV
jgi:aarF domain-containing kinase